MKKLLFILAFILAFSCDDNNTNESCNPKCEENSTCVDKHCCKNVENATIKSYDSENNKCVYECKSGFEENKSSSEFSCIESTKCPECKENFTCVDKHCCENIKNAKTIGYENDKCIYECNSGFKACKKEDGIYNCSNIDFKNDDFDCIDQSDIKTCLNGKACDEDKSEKNLAPRCMWHIEEGVDKSICKYYCKDGFGDCNNDIETDGCEANLKEKNLKQCNLCTDDSCNFDGDFSNGCEPMPDTLSTCDNCKNGYCNFDGDLTNGCEPMPESLVDCNHCRIKPDYYCDYDNDFSNGCVLRHETLDGCKRCKSGYINSDGDWLTGCEPINYDNDPDNCGQQYKKCPTSTDPLKIRQCKNGQCGFICNLEIAHVSPKGNCCFREVSFNANGQCGECLNDELKNDCHNVVEYDFIRGKVTKCVRGKWYENEYCPYTYSCNDNTCGDCFNGKYMCLSKDELGICRNGKWEHAADCERNCFDYYCPDPNE